MQLLFLLIFSVFASEEKETIKRNSDPKILECSAQNSILVKIEEDEYVKKHTSHYIGVRCQKQNGNWRAERWSKKERKYVYNGSYKDEVTAAHASDTLARKLIASGEKGHKLNFPEDDTEVHPEKTSIYIGVSYYERLAKWRVDRRSKKENKTVNNGTYKDEVTAAHASDTLARKLNENGETRHKLNFPDDDTEVYPKKKSQYIGVSYRRRDATWRVCRWSKNKKKRIYNGQNYKDEETAAHASDTVARKLIANGETRHKLNFPDDDTEVYPEIQNNKRKRPADFNNSEKYGQSLDKFE